MSKSYKPMLLYFITLIISIVSIVIFVVVVRISYEQLLMRKDVLLKELSTLLQEQKKLNVIYQDLISEDNIIPFALNQLMMVRSLHSDKILKISKDKINYINEYIKKKYE